MSDNKDISVNTTRNSVGQLISSQSIDGVKYYTYRFHLFIVSEDNTNLIQILKVDNYFLKEWLYFVKMTFLINPTTGGDVNNFINGIDQNSGWLSTYKGQDVLELVTTKQVQYFDMFVTYPESGAGWCIYEDDVLVYKDVVNLGTGKELYNAWYHYPLNNGNLPHKLEAIKDNVGQGWRLIRQLPPNSPKVRWFPGDTNFTDVNHDDQLLFTTGNGSYWCITTRYDVCGDFTDGLPNQIKVVPAIDSNFGQTNIQIDFRPGEPNEPSIFLRNSSDNNIRRMYRENLDNTYNLDHIDTSGMFVYARSTKIVPIPNIFRYKFNMFIRSHHTRNDMVIYTTNTIKIDGVFLEEYLHLESYITNYVNDIASGYIHWRTDYDVYFEKNVIEIVTTSRVTNFQIRYVNKSMVPGLKIYENDNLVYQDVTNGGSTLGSIWINYPLNNPLATPIPPTRYYGKYKQITTSYDGVTGQVSSLSENYINALTSSYAIDGNGSTVENLSNHKNNLINIITTTIPDAENNITIRDEDKLTNIITTTKKENNAIEENIRQIVVENPPNSNGVQITTETNLDTSEYIIVTTNHVDTSEFERRTIVTNLSSDAFISWVEESEPSINVQGNSELRIKIKNVLGGTINEQLITTIDNQADDTRTIQTVNNIDKSAFETSIYVTRLSSTNIFVSWTEISERTVIGSVEEVTTVEKDNTGFILVEEISTYDATNESLLYSNRVNKITNEQVFFKYNADETTQYSVKNDYSVATYSDGSYPVLNIDAPNFILSQPFPTFFIHTQTYEPSNPNFIEDRLNITLLSNNTNHLTCFRFKESCTGSRYYIVKMSNGSDAQTLIRDYSRLKQYSRRWFISFIYRPTNNIVSYNDFHTGSRLIQLIWNKVWPGSGATGTSSVNTSCFVFGRQDGKIELYWYMNSSGSGRQSFRTLSPYVCVVNQDNVISIEVDNLDPAHNKSRWRIYINGDYGWYRDIHHYSADDSGSNEVYIKEIRHAYKSTGYEIKDILYGTYVKHSEGSVAKYIRDLDERRHNLALPDIAIYNDYATII